MKNEKFLLDIQIKCGDIANEIPNAPIDAERTFKCKWPKNLSALKAPTAQNGQTHPNNTSTVADELFEYV